MTDLERDLGRRWFDQSGIKAGEKRLLKCLLPRAYFMMGH